MNLKPLISALLLFISVNASAQKWSVGLNAGALLNSKPEQMPNYRVPGISPAASLDLNYDINAKWRAGISLDYQRISSRFDGNVTTENGFDPLTGYTTTEHVQFKLYHPTYSIVGRFSRIFTIKRFQYIAGISTGYYRMYDGNSRNRTTSEKLFGSQFATDGFRAGLQARVNYDLTEKWALSGALNGDCFFYPQKVMMPNKSFVSGSLNVGIIYAFK